MLDLRRWRRDIFHSVSKPRSRCTQYGLAFAVLKLSFRIAQIGYLFPDVAASLQKQWVSPWSWCLRQMDGRRYRDLALESRSSPAELSQWFLLSPCRSGPTQWPCDPCNLLAQYQNRHLLGGLHPSAGKDCWTSSWVMRIRILNLVASH